MLLRCYYANKFRVAGKKHHAAVGPSPTAEIRCLNEHHLSLVKANALQDEDRVRKTEFGCSKVNHLYDCRRRFISRFDPRYSVRWSYR